MFTAVFSSQEQHWNPCPLHIFAWWLSGEGPNFHWRFDGALYLSPLRSCDSLELGGGGHPESLAAAPCFPTGFFKLKTASGRFLTEYSLSLLLGLLYPKSKPAAFGIIEQRNRGFAACKLVGQVLQKDVGLWCHRIWAAWKCWHFVVSECFKVLLWPKGAKGMHHTCRPETDLKELAVTFSFDV